VRRLLVANRGEIARRVFRTAKAMGIATVAVFSDADEHAPHVRDADEAVRLPGTTPADTYLNVEAVLAACRSTGADAVHPGYGFLSENAGFARACAAAGITFVGPSPEAIEAMGSKIAAKELMAKAGVPVLGAEGFPLLVKASFGGGGRGMRVVRDESELQEALASAEREAAAAFGDGTVFLERYVEDPRHIEVQVFGDSHGNVVHLYERECSIQRRYQKILEEAPSPAVDDALRERLGEAAVAAAKALDYVGAGTVEFVMDQAGEFFFLEVNTRLQVEHPVTEAITGLDLVELQLRVARGEALPPIPPIDGHAVEVRLYAEDVEAGFVPASGPIHRFDVPGDVRVDSGYEAGSSVSTFYDAMLAKVIGWAPTRDEAVAKVADALAGTRVHGVPTNRDLLVRVLRHPGFAEGATDTGFLDRHALVAVEPDPAVVERHAVVAALAAAAERRATAKVQPHVPAGWRNVRQFPQVAAYEEAEVRYSGTAVEGHDVHVWSAAATAVDVTIDGVRRTYEVDRVGDVTYVDGADGSTTLHAVERFTLPDAAVAAGSLLAPLPGSVVRVLVEPGAEVAQGQTLVVLEAMKMEHSVQSPTAGTVNEVRVAVGDQVEGGQVLAVVDA
jgi:acetyl/propionyl-CoA carboxylase alpha subunit